MKEAFDLIKERLEEESKFAVSLLNGKTDRYVAGVCDTNKKAIKIVSEVEAEYGNGWIPCSERLPEVGRCVICYAKGNDEDSGEMLYGWYCGESKLNPSWSLLRFDSENWPLEYEDKVVAWMPLPEPYKPVRGELNAKEK